MKKLAFIFLLLTVGLLPSCKKDKTFTLGVDVESIFNNDSVQVYVDGQELINKRLTTIAQLGVCDHGGQIATTKNEGNHEIKVVINNIYTKTEIFPLSNDLYIGIHLNPQTNEISLFYSKQRFMYD